MFVKSESIDVKPRPQWSTANYTHIVEYISSAEMLHVSDNL